MRILAINTATEACSVALWNKNTIYSHFEICPCEHNKRILYLVKSVLDQSKISVKELDMLAYCRGPGSFTGVRIGMGVAQGLALGIEIPMIGISTLATMAQGAWRCTGETRILTALDARMGEVYWAEYTKDKTGYWHGEKSEKILKIASVNTRIEKISGKWAKVGSGWKSCVNIDKKCNIHLQDEKFFLPSAEDMIPIAFQLIKTGKVVSVERAELIYLRNKIAHIKP